jgi:hypothetical protein
MTVSYQDVLDEAGAGATDQDVAERVLAEAEIHVAEFIAANLISEDNPVPDEIEDSGVLKCAVDLFQSAKNPTGVQMLPDGSGNVVAQRLAIDPLARVRPLFARWCLPDLGIA